MQLEAFKALLSTSGQEVLAAAQARQPRELDFLPHFQQLARAYPPELARAALETAILRCEAESKFPFASKLYLERQALEQASSWEVASYRAGRYAGFRLVVDLGCSIGGDSLALAQKTFVLGVDQDRLRLAMAQANAAALGLKEQLRFVRADLTQPLPFIPLDNQTALFFDPARRAEGRRIFSIREYQPPLAVLRLWQDSFPATGVKISPGVDLAELAEYDAEIEFISLRGELKEAVLWFGPLRSAWRRATLLPGEHTLASETGIPQDPLPLSAPREYIYEPDPAVLRAGLVSAVGRRLQAYQLDPDIAYLTADQQVSTPFARCWQVEDWMPFQLKRLRLYLRQRSVGRVTVKKRGSPLQPERLIQDLRLQGTEEKLLFLTHLLGKPIVVIAREINLPGEQ
jgi:hypothetical protein